MNGCRSPFGLFTFLGQFVSLICHFLHLLLCHLMRNLVQLFDILYFHYFFNHSFLNLGLSLEVVEDHLNAVVIITNDLISLSRCPVIIDLDHLLDLLKGHSWKLHSLEARQLKGQVARTGDDDVVVRVLLPNEFDLFYRQFIQGFHEEDLSLFFSPQSQHKLHVKSCLLDSF